MRTTTNKRTKARLEARADVTMMAAAYFDQLMASLETPDQSPELDELFARPTQIDG